MNANRGRLLAATSSMNRFGSYVSGSVHHRGSRWIEYREGPTMVCFGMKYPPITSSSIANRGFSGWP
ncbi:Uncharacterised protein [Mycobacteroides abscessus subsp. abscessus]|nr:Uncharacterised protein [Mycobacteroides abscessus subsp. abscessus]